MTKNLHISVIFLIFDGELFALQDDGIMEQDVDGDVAINLSTSQRPSAATTPNGSIEHDEGDQVSEYKLLLPRRKVALIREVFVIWIGKVWQSEIRILRWGG